ncbi:MAG: YraN family protein [Pirellulales bacterium]|nr:YraN family protein [Pirellulales bacterium]
MATRSGALEVLLFPPRIRAWLTNQPWINRWRPTPTIGQRGEQAAARFLQRKGFAIVARGQRQRIGEIDLVAVDSRTSPRTIVFVEVKTRESHAAGHPAEAIDEHKQTRLTRLALAYLKFHSLLDQPARFDVVAITWPSAARQPTIEHIENAFEARGSSGMFS